MNHIKTFKINDVKVKPIKVEKIDPKSIKGFDITGANLYPNVFSIAMKGSGKTTVLFNSLKKIVDKNTKVFFFVSTFYNDQSFEIIREWLESKEIEYHAFTEIGKDFDELMNLFTLDAKHELEQKQLKETEEEPVDVWKMSQDDAIKQVFENEEEYKVRVKKPKKVSPKYMIIFDDMSSDLRMKKVSVLIKQNRHYKCCTWISSQNALDLNNDARNNINIYLLFPNIPSEKLVQFYESATIPITYDKFEQLYHYATAKPHNFLYINRDANEFRHNFDTKLEL